MSEAQLKNRMKPHAVIVEDESALSEVYEFALSQAGYYVQTFSNGQDAINHLKKVSPRLILLDINLPGANGDEVLDSIVDVPAFKDTKIFLITANARLGKYLADKVDLVLDKPVRYKLLMQLAERYKPKKNRDISLGDESIGLSNATA